ncbi:amidohydrolase family protein [Tsukamurella paurometabola]
MNSKSTGESAWFSVGGVKIIMDGVIDACTAAMRRPYADGSNAEPIWSAERLTPVALAADAAGLQIAVHAIGDRTSEIAVDILEECARSAAGPSGEPRHRLEHLETVTDRTIARMAALGIIASLQPVHSDPAIMDNWKAVLGMVGRSRDSRGRSSATPTSPSHWAPMRRPPRTKRWPTCTSR